jgi:lantibiotic modifying enzyme
MNAWCHGAPGVAVAALAALDGGRDVEMLAQARMAIGQLAKWDANQADHLCCGHLGRVDVMLAAGVRLTGAPALDAAREIAARVVARARRQRHFRLSTAGFEYRVRDAGLFRGLSGIGYALLRAAEPVRVPSVLAFEVVR